MLVIYPVTRCMLSSNFSHFPAQNAGQTFRDCIVSGKSVVGEHLPNKS